MGLNYGLAFCLKRLVSRFFAALYRVFCSDNPVYMDIAYGLWFAAAIGGLFLYLATGGNL